MPSTTFRASSAFAPVQTDSTVSDQFGQLIRVGDLVANFGYTARVVEVRDAQTLVLRGAGLNTSRAALFGQSWTANPARCQKAGA